MSSSMKAVNVIGPWKGVIADQPAGFDNAAFDSATNVVFRKGRIMTRPPLVALLPAPPDGNPIINMYSFIDTLNNWHTAIFTIANVYALGVSNGTFVYNALTKPSTIFSFIGTGLPFSLLELNQKVFFCNGSAPLLYADGSDTLRAAGNVPGSCRYLTENKSYLIGCDWTIPAPGETGSTRYPFYVRIAAANDPFEWIPSDANDATVINLIEQGGLLMGCVTLGAYTYVWREFGANVLFPTGSSSSPFYNEPFNWSNPGWGVYYPYSLATWNKSCFFATHGGDVISYNGSSGPTVTGFASIADGKVRKAIAADLAVVDRYQVYGFVSDRLGPGFDFDAYHLWIPALNKAWVYNITEGTWSVFTSLGRYATSFRNIKVS